MSSSGKIIYLVNPDNSQDAATKSYVDSGVATATAVGNNAQSTADAVKIATTWGRGLDAHYLYPSNGQAAGIITNGSYRVYVLPNGNVGIGKTDPANILDIYTTSGNCNLLLTSDSWPGTCSIRMKAAPSSPVKPDFEISTFDNTYDNFTSIWNHSESDMRFGTFGGERMRITRHGNVGIGTASPSFPLEINTSSTGSFGPNVHYLINSNYQGLYTYSEISSHISLKTSGSIWMNGTHIIFSSDQRIKKNITSLNTDKMMNIFRTLRPISFDFIDPIKNNNKKHFGFIAQEVNEVLPEGISLNTDVIPNNMMKADIAKPSETDENPNFTLKPDETDITLQYLFLTTDKPLKFDTANIYSSTDTYKFKVYCGKEWAKEHDIYIRSEYNVTDDKYIYVIGMKRMYMTSL